MINLTNYKEVVFKMTSFLLSDIFPYGNEAIYYYTNNLNNF